MDTSLVPCGDQLCPSGYTCSEDRCASAEQLDACSGHVDGDACSVRGGVGLCDRGLCIAVGCGNGTVELGEACDDANTVGGDGCSADCSKFEVCGDGTVDQGEACDDGNANAADGCDACIATAWSSSALIGGSILATSIGLTFPYGVALDRGGNLYITDTSGRRVRRVDRNGVITTIAGTGQAGTGGDGGPATSAQLFGPGAVAVDGLGNVYVTDRDRVRRIDPDGIITTIAGTSVAGFSGDNGPASSARLDNPNGLAIDGLGNLYIADSDNARVRRVDAAGRITTVAGTGVPGETGDGGLATAATIRVYGVAVDAAGNLYIADGGYRIRKVDAAGVISTIVGAGSGYAGDGGPATAALLQSTIDVAIDETGNLFILDEDVVRRVDTSGIITTVAGNGDWGFSGDGGPAVDASLYVPTGVAVGGGDVFIADRYNHRVRRVDDAGIITTFAGMASDGLRGDGGIATGGRMEWPIALAFDTAGNMYIADQDNYRIRRVDTDGFISSFAGNGEWGLDGDGGPASEAMLRGPTGLAFDAAGNLYVADAPNNCVRRIAPDGIITTVAGTGTAGYSGDDGAATSAELDYPYSVAVDATGALYIADTDNHRVRRVGTDGVITTVAGTGIEGFGGDDGPAFDAQLSSPWGVAFDAAGNLFVADFGNDRVRRISPGGTITTVVGSGVAGDGGDGGPAIAAELSRPQSLSFDGAGNLYVSDGARLRRVDGNGVITAFAGDGTDGDSGDGGPAIGASLSYPTGTAADAMGNIYLATSNNGRVRRVAPSGIITTVAGLIDPERMGPFAQARMADPQALVVTGAMTLVAGGASGTVQAARDGLLAVAAGRYQQNEATGALARFRHGSFGTVGGLAYDAEAQIVYVTETSANRVHAITLVDPADENTWTIAPLANASATSGFLDGAAATARFRAPTGLQYDGVAKRLYVADTGNHAIRAIDLTAGIGAATVQTVFGQPATRGFFGDGGPARDALLFAPRALARCGNGDMFIADTGNHRVRRVASDGTITTVVGVGVAASSGDGVPAAVFPVDTPGGLACDSTGNLYVTSRTTVRMLAADAAGIVDGTRSVQTIYGLPPRDTFPTSVTRCLTGIAVVSDTTVHVADSCTGLLVGLERGPR